MSIAGGTEYSSAFALRLCSKSAAKMVVRVRRWSNEAAEGALSAFMVAKSNNSRCGLVKQSLELSFKADIANAW